MAPWMRRKVAMARAPYRAGHPAGQITRRLASADARTSKPV
jgi:hypothetical protein